jgi:hypothetical protein
MVLEHLYCPLGGIDAMVVGFDDLPGTVMLFEECFDGGSGLIVCYIEHGFMSFCGEVVEDCLECRNDMLAGVGLYG